MFDVVEPQFAEEFTNIIRRSRVFIDIGAASDGWYTLKACKSNPAIRVVAVEPLKNEILWLYRNLIINNCNSRVLALKMALSDRKGAINMDGEVIPVTSLDSLVDSLSLDSVDVIKLDVEGFGGKIINGGIHTITKYKPVRFYELHNKDEVESLKKLVRVGYKIIVKAGLMAIAQPL
ncbi:FkbM family methyltransferase [Pyrobaculum aerophilum]|uniref:FkbM family methyltransferase n=1 Tax=Pyrobaculum aerophilum TaxID=13773 RepID=UPI0023F3BB57|nr:FkbM family methyltransferase [Pyrobaculum aerophilum]MCX8137681.1 FkbM family methyltransferase [Pyrobaculum aerophilum]